MHPISAPVRLIAALTLLAALTGCGSGDENRESKTFDLTSDELTISKTNGALDLRPADVDQVEVTRWFTGDRDDATWEMAEDKLTLDTDCGLLSSCEVRYEVRVPQSIAVSVSGENGTITAAEFSTALEISTDNGAIRISDVTGALALKSSNGKQRATGLTSREVTARSESGKVDLSFDDPPTDVSISTENGSVRLAVPDVGFAISTNTDNGHVKNSLTEDPSSGNRLDITTENGSITLTDSAAS